MTVFLGLKGNRHCFEPWQCTLEGTGTAQPFEEEYVCRGVVSWAAQGSAAACGPSAERLALLHQHRAPLWRCRQSLGVQPEGPAALVPPAGFFKVRIFMTTFKGNPAVLFTNWITKLPTRGDGLAPACSFPKLVIFQVLCPLLWVRSREFCE